LADPPRYQAPQPSAEEQALAAQTAEQNKQATQADARTDTARLMAIYGTRLAMGGQSIASPLLSSPAALVGGDIPGYPGDQQLPSGGY
jgi:hypothetical protein